MIKSFINRVTDNLIGRPLPQYPNATVSRENIMAYNQGRKPGLTGSFCYAPGINMLFGQDGKIRACCHNMEFTLGQYPQQSIKEIWSSKEAAELRTHLQNFDLSHGCDICQADMDSRSFDEVRAKQFDSLPLNSKYPVMMEFLMTNTCNLECVMCKGEYSSLIRKNREKLPALVSPYDKEFLKQLEEFIPHLYETRFSGSGEAFAIDMNYEIWEMIIRLNPNCVIMVQTNGSFMNARIRDLLSRGNFRIGISLDSLQKENFEAIRINANFEKVMENVIYFSQHSLRKNQKFALALCVMRQNWKELPEFIRFCNANNAVATLHKVWFPVEYALHNLPFNQLSEIHDFLASFDFPGETRLEKLNRQHYKYMVSVIGQWKENALLDKGDAFVSNGAKRWRESTFKSDVESLSIDSMPESDLLPYLKQRLTSELAMNHSTGADIELVLQLCDEKIGGVLDSYNLEGERINILRQICKVPPGETIKSLRHASVETMTEHAKIFLVGALSK